MDIQGYNTLLTAAIHGDTPKTRLKSLLFAVRSLLFGDCIDSVAMWITGYKDDGPEAAQVSLQKDDLKFPQEDNDKDGNENVLKAETMLNSAYTLELPELSDSRPAIAGYLHFSKQPLASGNWLQATASLIGRALLELKRERTETIVYSILNYHREKIFQASKSIGQADIDKIGTDIASAFNIRSLWVLLYDFGSWRRSPRGGPLVTFQGQQPLEDIQDSLYQTFYKEIYKLLEQDKGHPKDIAREVQLSGLPDKLRDLRFYIAAAPLAYPKKSDADAGVPYIAVVVLNEPEHSLDEQEQNLLKRFVLELQRVLRFRDELKQVTGMVDLLQKFLSLPSPNEVADLIVDYLSKTFKATEVAVLERRGMYLSIIGEKNVPVQAIPPLHIPTTEARVCDVARNREERYDLNVQEKDSYLPVVPATKSQFTVPLIWRSDLVGVLVIGLSVLDGFELRNLKIIRALAGYCAAAIAGSQRTAEERAVSHMLSEVLTGATLKIHQVMYSEEINFAHRDKLETTFGLLNQCQTFIENFRQAQNSTKQKGRAELRHIDLRRVVAKYIEDPLTLDLLREHPNCSIAVNSFPEPLVANAYEEGLHIALHNIVSNGLEAMEETPGKISISMNIEKVWYEASRKHVHFGVVMITDEGKGVSRPEQFKIFDPFYSTKQNHLGSGLHIAQRIIEGFGGRIELHSPAPESGKGSRFALWIPIERKESKNRE